MATIMIVEDDRQTNDAVSEYLKSFGHRMLSAYDGDEALQLFECSSIDLIILDIMIPQKTGLAVLHTIRQKSSVPILMLTAIGDEYTQVTSFDEQADDYITKPFSMVLLGRRVTALLRRSGQTVTPDIMTFGDVTVDFSGYTAKGPEGKIDITPKEIDLLKLLVEHKGLLYLTVRQLIWAILIPQTLLPKLCRNVWSSKSYWEIYHRKKRIICSTMVPLNNKFLTLAGSR